MKYGSTWTAKLSNETVLQDADTTKSLLNRIRKGQATFFSHVIRREKLEHLVISLMIEGKRNRKTTRKDVGWTNKVAENIASNR